MKRLFLAMTGFIWLFPCIWNPSSITIAAEPNLVGYWKFDEGTGATAYDSSGNNFNGTINGATWFNDPVQGWCLSFDGINDYVNIPNNTALNITRDITISAWVYFQTSGSTKGDYR